MYQWGLRTNDRSFYAAAISAFSRAITLRPLFASAYLHRAMICSRELGDHERGINDLTCAIACAPERAELYLRRGLIRRFHGAHDDATADLRRFLELDATSSWRGEAERQLAQLADEQ